MSYLILPKKVFNSPLIEYANFVNLIKLNKPYANGISYAVYETTNNAFCSNGLFKTYEKAKLKFELMIKNHSYQSKVIERKKLLTKNKNK